MSVLLNGSPIICGTFTSKEPEFHLHGVHSGCSTKVRSAWHCGAGESRRALLCCRLSSLRSSCSKPSTVIASGNLHSNRIRIGESHLSLTRNPLLRRNHGLHNRSRVGALNLEAVGARDESGSELLGTEEEYFTMAIKEAGSKGPALLKFFKLLKHILQSFLLAIYGFLNDYMAKRASILRPIRERPGANETLLVIVPGAFTKAEAYLPLANAIQEASKLKLWVVVLNFVANVPTSFELKQRYGKALEKTKMMGFGGNGAATKVYFAGHSWGAWEARDPALHLADGFIQMGAYFNKKLDKLPEYPKPVLTLGGELDGQIPPTVMARHAGEVFAVEAQLGRANTVAQKPVVVVEGMNHCQFSHGVPNRKRGDFDPEVPIEQARREVAEVVAAFLELQVAGREAGPEGQQAWAALEAAVSKTERDYRAFWEACLQETRGCSHYQMKLLEEAQVVPHEGLSVEVVWHDFLQNFVFSKPAIAAGEGKVHMQAYKKPQGRYDLASDLWLKMKSAEAVATAGLGDVSEWKTENEPRLSKGELAGAGAGAGVREASLGGAAAGSSGISSGPLEEFTSASASGSQHLSVSRHLFESASANLGAQWNEAHFRQALSLVPETARRRFERRGKKPTFGTDEKCSSGATWVGSDMKFISKEGGTVEIRSPVLLTPADYYRPRFAGMHYVKIWSVARAMEWIMVDSLR